MHLPKFKKLLAESVLKEQFSPTETKALLKFFTNKQETERDADFQKIIGMLRSGHVDLKSLGIEYGDHFENLDIEAQRMGVFSPQELRDLNKAKDKFFSWYGGDIFKQRSEDVTIHTDGREEKNLKQTWNRVWKGRQG